MAIDRRTDLVDAGISLLSEQRFQELLASVETRSIADDAGVTTGSFFHHFRNRSHFAMAVADAFVPRALSALTDAGVRVHADPAIMAYGDGTASDREPNSRLSCQITVTRALDGLVVNLPERQV